MTLEPNSDPEGRLPQVPDPSNIKKANLKALFDALVIAGILSVTVEFDGYGDSGQVENIWCGSAEARSDLPKLSIAFLRDNAPPGTVETFEVPLDQALEDVAYDILEDGQMGWQDGDGSFGVFIFDVEARLIRLDFNSRFTDFTSSTRQIEA